VHDVDPVAFVIDVDQRRVTNEGDLCHEQSIFCSDSAWRACGRWL
jgi:hypothetical protein